MQKLYIVEYDGNVIMMMEADSCVLFSGPIPELFSIKKRFKLRKLEPEEKVGRSKAVIMKGKNEKSKSLKLTEATHDYNNNLRYLSNFCTSRFSGFQIDVAGLVFRLILGYVLKDLL
jgi:hypothetical protein